MNPKNLLLLCSVLFCTGLFASHHHLKAQEDKPTVELSFKLTDHGKKVGDYYLLIYCDTNAADTLFVRKGRVAYLQLDYNHNYTLRYVKEGYRDRVVIVRTNIAQNVKPKDMDFDFEIGLVKETAAANTFADLPVAIIRYDVHTKKFDYSRKYHRQIRQKSRGRKTL
jgi:hypothetical protein